MYNLSKLVRFKSLGKSYLRNKLHISILPCETKSKMPVDLFLPAAIILSITACRINQDNAAIAPITVNNVRGSTLRSQQVDP